MGLLGTTSLLAIVTTSACYSPELRDCTLVCVSPRDCASGQVCGSDGLCASIERAGRCSQLPADAGTQIPDDGATEVTMLDASVPIDAPPDAPTRGAITLPGYKADADKCCKHETPKQEAPSKDRASHCAVCFFAARLSMPVAIDMAPQELARCGQHEAPVPEIVASLELQLTYLGRAPPNV